MSQCAYTTAGARCPAPATHVVLRSPLAAGCEVVPAPAPCVPLSGAAWPPVTRNSRRWKQRPAGETADGLRFHPPEFCEACATLVAAQRNTEALRFAPEHDRLVRLAQRTVLTAEEEAQIVEIVQTGGAV